MIMKRLLKIMAVAAVVMVAACITCFILTRPAPGKVDGQKIMTALQSYTADLRAHGQAMPATVSLHDLISKGWLKPEDVSGFSGMEVTISLIASESNPQDVMMRVRMQDGSEIVGMADGSVQSVRR